MIKQPEELLVAGNQPPVIVQEYRRFRCKAVIEEVTSEIQKFKVDEKTGFTATRPVKSPGAGTSNQEPIPEGDPETTKGKTFTVEFPELMSKVPHQELFSNPAAELPEIDKVFKFFFDVNAKDEFGRPSPVPGYFKQLDGDPRIKKITEEDVASLRKQWGFA